jgi:hypothetical protein
MILCDDWEQDLVSSRRLNILGLITNIRSHLDPPFPLVRDELCVFLVLTECRGTGEGDIRCVFEETGEVVFTTAKQSVRFGNDPLEVVGMAFRIRNCRFPYSGLYSVQFWYNNDLVEERPLRLR